MFDVLYQRSNRLSVLLPIEMPPIKRKSGAVAKGPSPAAICDLLMTKSTEPIQRDKVCRDGSSSSAMYIKYICIKCGTVKWKETTAGPTNAYNHLVGCYGTHAMLQKMYNEATQRMALGQGSSIASFLKSSSSTPKEDAVFSWIDIIVDKSWPLSYVEDDSVRAFSTHNFRLSAKYIKEVLYKLVELVEDAVAAEMSKAPIGAIMHDGWSKVSTHYFGLYATYSLKVGAEYKPYIALLSVSPIQQELDADDSDDSGSEDDPTDDATEAGNEETPSAKVTVETGNKESTRFNSDAHCSFIKSTFKNFFAAVDFNNWCVAQICDNAAVNRSIASKLKIKHIGCKSHQLALDVKDMLKADKPTSTLLDHIHKTMTSIKTKNTNAALLRNITELRPVLDNKTRWSGKFSMVDRYCRIYDDILKASQEENASIDISRVASFTKARKVQLMLGEINEVTKALQESKLSLCQGRKFLEDLSRQVNRKKNDPMHALYQCKLKLKKSAIVSELAPDHLFESGVIKIQSGNWKQLTADEEEACSKLLKPEEDQAPITAVQTTGSPVKMRDRIKRMKMDAEKRAEQSSPYHDLSFLFASAAEVERLWSKALYIFVQQRRKMHPQLLEALLFLKENRRFWDKAMVMEAMNTLKDSRDGAANTD